MATDNQIKYYKALCYDLGESIDPGFEDLTTKEASVVISDLKEQLEEEKNGDGYRYD